jgi:hypothetical protein
MAFDDKKIDLIVESDWKWWVIGKGVLTVHFFKFKMFLQVLYTDVRYQMTRGPSTTTPNGKAVRQ